MLLKLETLSIKVTQLHEQAQFVKYDHVIYCDLVATEVRGIEECLVKYRLQLDEVQVPFCILLLYWRR